MADAKTEVKNIQRYVGTCRGGPYDGQTVEHDKPRYPVIIWCSTADDPFAMEQWRKALDWNDTHYEFRDSTWVWVPK